MVVQFQLGTVLSSYSLMDGWMDGQYLTKYNYSRILHPGFKKCTCLRRSIKCRILSLMKLMIAFPVFSNSTDEVSLNSSLINLSFSRFNFESRGCWGNWSWFSLVLLSGVGKYTFLCILAKSQLCFLEWTTAVICKSWKQAN